MTDSYRRLRRPALERGIETCQCLVRTTVSIEQASEAPEVPRVGDPPPLTVAEPVGDVTEQAGQAGDIDRVVAHDIDQVVR
jgi:hypothetical protein